MPSRPVPLRVGVTGGIGSGKSTVCRIFKELGRPVFYADAIANSIAEEDPDTIEQITRLLGREAYDRQGRMNRAYVARRIFSEKSLRKQLEAIIHPAVFSALEKGIATLPPEEALPYVVIEAALIYESGMDKDLDYVIAVDADEEERIHRLLQHGGMTREEILARIAAQMSVQSKLQKADFIIRNNTDTSSLISKVRFIHTLLMHLKKSS